MTATMRDWDVVKRWRRDTRASLIARRLAADPRQRRAWSAEIERHLLPLIHALDRKIIGFYWPFKGEFDPRRLVREIQASDGWYAVLPVVLARNAPMEFRHWTPGADMEPGIWNIPVPKTTETALPDLVLAPLVGFDRANYRLGYGGGYFDRTLGALRPRPLAIGIGFELSRLDSVHPQPHDVPMDFIVTEAGMQERARESGPGA